MNEIFSSRRFGLLLRNDAIAGYRSLLVVSATLAGIVLIIAIVSRGSASGNESFYLTWFTMMLLIWGPIVASRSFNELHDKTKNEAYLLLPASGVEKTIARLLFATVIFLGYLLVFTILTSVVVEAANSLLFGQHNRLFRPFDPMGWTLVGHFVVIQSVYFLGAAWFRKSHFIKTTLAIVIACIGLAILALVILRIMLAPYFDGFDMSLDRMSIDNLYSLYQGTIDVARMFLTTLYFAGLPVMCWLIAWLRVKETQVSDGV